MYSTTQTSNPSYTRSSCENQSEVSQNPSFVSNRLASTRIQETQPITFNFSLSHPSSLGSTLTTAIESIPIIERLIRPNHISDASQDIQLQLSQSASRTNSTNHQNQQLSTETNAISNHNQYHSGVTSETNHHNQHLSTETNATSNQNQYLSAVTNETNHHNQPHVPVNQNQGLPCNCIKGNCISGTCRCLAAKRACTPFCHKGTVNENCAATLQYYSRQN